jgi:hypothetical protein
MPIKILGERIESILQPFGLPTRSGGIRKKKLPQQQFHILWKHYPDQPTWEPASTFVGPGFEWLQTDWQKRVEFGLNGTELADPDYYYDTTQRIVMHTHKCIYTPAKILDERSLGKRKQFLILWQTLAVEAATWELQSQFAYKEFDQLLLDWRMRCIHLPPHQRADATLYWDDDKQCIIKQSADNAHTHSGYQYQHCRLRQSMPIIHEEHESDAAAAAIASSVAVAVPSHPLHWCATRYYGSRDYLRRLLYVLNLIRKQQAHKIQWQLYSHQTLHKMKQYLSFDCDMRIFDTINRAIIIRAINARLFLRPAPGLSSIAAQLDASEKPWIIKLEWTSTMLRHTNLRTIRKWDKLHEVELLTGSSGCVSI